MKQLTDTEKAYFDTIRDPDEPIALIRMYLDDQEVAVICSVVTGTGFPGDNYLPLAVILDRDAIERLSMPVGDGETHRPEMANPADLISSRPNRAERRRKG